MKKCQDEGLDINNHMATISAGLAATIKEWFSEGDHTTAVETAEKVDLEKVRVKKSRGKKPAEEKYRPQPRRPQETLLLLSQDSGSACRLMPRLLWKRLPSRRLSSKKPARRSRQACTCNNRAAKAGTIMPGRSHARKTRAGKTYRPAGRANRGTGTCRVHATTKTKTKTRYAGNLTIDEDARKEGRGRQLPAKTDSRPQKGQKNELTAADGPNTKPKPQRKPS